MAAILDVTHAGAHHIIHDLLQFHKMCARLVPREVTPELKERRVNACQELLRQYETEGDGFLKRIVTGDEAGSTTTSLKQRGQAKNGAIQAHQHRKIPQGKVMLMLCWDHQGPLVEYYKSMGTHSHQCLVL
jgi:hypothetical protein